LVHRVAKVLRENEIERLAHVHSQ